MKPNRLKPHNIFSKHRHRFSFIYLFIGKRACIMDMEIGNVHGTSINSGMHMKKHDHNSHGFQARKSNA
jgi:hypothetical protein